MSLLYSLIFTWKPFKLLNKSAQLPKVCSKFLVRDKHSDILVRMKRVLKISSIQAIRFCILFNLCFKCFVYLIGNPLSFREIFLNKMITHLIWRFLAERVTKSHTTKTHQRKALLLKKWDLNWLAKSLYWLLTSKKACKKS